MMTREDLLAQALAVGFTEAQFKALTAPQRIAFLQSAAAAKTAGSHARIVESQVALNQVARLRQIAGPTGVLQIAPAGGSAG